MNSAQDGSAIVRDVLISGMSPEEIAKARGQMGQNDGRFWRMRLAECLKTLAVLYGFGNGDRAVHSVEIKSP